MKCFLKWRLLRLAIVMACCFSCGWIESAAQVAGDPPKPAKETVKTAEEGAEKSLGNYRLLPGDKITINVFQERDLSGEFTISQTGEITFPLLVAVKVVGMTCMEVEQVLKRRLIDEDFMVDPQITVSVKEYRKRYVSVTGKVARPGLIDLPPEQPMNIVQVITAAGGLLPIAKSNDIQLTRPGEEKPRRFKWDELQRETDPSKVFIVKEYDLIYVPERLL